MEKLFDLLENGVTASHTITYIQETLKQNDFEELSLSQLWNLEEGKSYLLHLYGTNSLAFRVGRHMTQRPQFRIAMAHSDYPCFQIKPDPLVKGRFVTKLNVEIYGGMNQKSWLDRPLGIAGNLIVKGEDTFSPKTILYKSDYPLCIIPSLAIHMDRELNKKGALDSAKELMPILSLNEDVDLMEMLAQAVGIQVEDILDYDLYLYNPETPKVIGIDEAMIASPRLDNLTSVAALLEGIQEGRSIPKNTIDIMVVFDHEEVGSLSKQGADSQLLSMIVTKIGKTIVGNTFSVMDSLSNSFLLSVDVAHANHPNYEEKSDLTNKAYLGKGVCIKRSVGQKYATTAESAAIMKNLCETKKIPYTIAINKTGILGGCTLGPIANSYLPFLSADIGMPILAMHATLELGAVEDYHSLKQFVTAFYTV